MCYDGPLMTRIQLTPAQIKTISELTVAKTLNVGPGDRSNWKSGQRSQAQLGDIQVESDTGISIAIRADGDVAEIDLGSYLLGPPPYGNDTPENRFRVAQLVLRFPGKNFGEVCRNAGITQDQFNSGQMPKAA